MDFLGLIIMGFVILGLFALGIYAIFNSPAIGIGIVILLCGGIAGLFVKRVDE